jgi:hypothetical protein
MPEVAAFGGARVMTCIPTRPGGHRLSRIRSAIGVGLPQSEGVPARSRLSSISLTVPFGFCQESAAAWMDLCTLTASRWNWSIRKLSGCLASTSQSANASVGKSLRLNVTMIYARARIALSAEGLRT